ncbi:MAG: metalloregulator ArsR/SmtB family transcription factor [Chloroflexi bacterium]|nr:metalloregulator ArsR/SmtB family transcription factor [Chloroflexota bacterium]
MSEDISEQIYRMHARVCKALADPKRLRIINVLRDGEMTVGEMARGLDLRQANLSQHLMLLRERGVVTTRRQGLNVYYSLSSPKIVQACEIMREVLAEHLARSAQLSLDLQAAVEAKS